MFVLAALAVAACTDTDSSPEVVRSDRTDAVSDSTPDSAPDSTPDSLPDDPPVDTGICSVLSQDEIEAALDRDVQPGVEDSFDEEVVRCTWTVTAPPPSPERSSDLKLQVLLFPLLDIERAELDGLAADPDNILVEGLGDLAVIENNILPGPIYVVLGDEYLEVDLANYSTPADFTEERIVELLTELAELVVPRL